MSPRKPMSPVEQQKAIIEEAAQDAVRIIVEATREAAKELAKDAAMAAKTVHDAAAVAVQVVDVKSTNDHELLIRLDEKMVGLKTDIGTLQSGVMDKIHDLEKCSAKLSDFDTLKIAHEALAKEVHEPREIRMRKLENKMYAIWIALTLYTLLNLGGVFMIVRHLTKT